MNSFYVILLTVKLLHQITALSTLPDNYTYPILDLSSRCNMAQGVDLKNLNGTIYTTMVAGDSYVSRLTNFGKLEIFDINTNELVFNLFNSTNNPTNKSVRNYDFYEGSSVLLGIIFDDNSASLYNLYPKNFTVQQFYSFEWIGWGRQAIQVYENQLSIFASDGLNARFAYRTRPAGWSGVTAYSTYYYYLVNNYNYYTYGFNMKKCRVNPTDQFYKIAFWKRNCFVEVLNCTSNYGCAQLFFDNNLGCNSTEYLSTQRDYFKLDWNHNCTKIMYESKKDGIKIFDMIQNSSVTLNINNVNASLNGFWFMDDFDQIVSFLWIDGRFQIYNMTDNFTKLDEKFVEASSVTAYRRSKRMLFVSNGQDLFAYSFGCNSLDFSLNQNGLCLPNGLNISAANTTVNNTANIATNTTTNVTTNTSNTTSNTTVNTTVNITTNTTANLTTNITTNITTNSSLDPVYPVNNSNISYQTNKTQNINIESNTTEKSSNQTIPNENIDNNPFTKFTTSFFQSVQQAVSYSIVMVRVLPIAAFFMRYINFWSICTMYLLPDLSIPERLREVIDEICSFINVSVFQLLGWNLSVDTNLTEKFPTDENSIFGFSSDIFNSNIENVIMFCFNNALLGITFGLSVFLATENCLKKHLSSINYRMVVLTQFVSMMQAFIYNFPIITQNSDQESFMDKVNMTFQNILFIFSCFVSCMAFIMFEREIEDSDMTKNEKKREKFDWFFDCQCHVLLPIIAAMKKNFLFLGFSGLFLCLPLFTAIKRKQYRVWFILRALYLPLFNLCVILLEILRGTEMTAIQDQVGFVTIFIIFAGAVHEILQFFGGLVLDIVRMVFKKSSKVSNAMKRKSIDDWIERISPDIYSQNIDIKSIREKYAFKKKITFLKKKQEISMEPNEQSFNEMVLQIYPAERQQVRVIQIKRRFKKIKTAKTPMQEKILQLQSVHNLGTNRLTSNELMSNRMIQEDIKKNSCLKDVKDIKFKEEKNEKQRSKQKCQIEVSRKNSSPNLNDASMEENSQAEMKIKIKKFNDYMDHLIQQFFENH